MKFFFRNCNLPIFSNKVRGRSFGETFFARDQNNFLPLELGRTCLLYNFSAGQITQEIEENGHTELIVLYDSGFAVENISNGNEDLFWLGCCLMQIFHLGDQFSKI